MTLSLVFFAVAAFMGAYLRLQMNQFLIMPWGTFAVNLIGSLLIGFLAVYLDNRYPQLKMVLLVAFLGSLTTFSGYSLDLVKLFEEGAAGKALLYMFSSNVLCFGGCYLGWKFAQKLVIAS